MSVGNHPNINAAALTAAILSAIVEYSRGEMAGPKALTPQVARLVTSFCVVVSETLDMEVAGRVFPSEYGNEEVFGDIVKMQRLLDLQQTRMTEAVSFWHENHPGKENILPDLGDLLHWLIEKSKVNQERWISVEESLPPLTERIDSSKLSYSKDLLVWLGDSWAAAYYAQFDGKEAAWISLNDLVFKVGSITHWRFPLPPS